MTVRRHLTKQLHEPGSYSALCSVPLPPPVLGGRDDDDTDWEARLLLSSGDGSIVAVDVVVAVGGRRGGGARRLTEFLAGVRRTSIEAGRYKAG
jgi:hypothetical protein